MPEASTHDQAQALRARALTHPTVAALKGQLDAYPEDARPNEGLYVETTDTAGLVVNGELRLSVLRVYTQSPHERHLVGQLQAVHTVDHPLQSWQLRFFIHEPEHYMTERVDDADAWFLRVLEHHYHHSKTRPRITPTPIDP